MKKGKTLVKIFANSTRSEQKRHMRSFLEMADMVKLPPKPKGMNKTETEFAWILEEQKRAGKIRRYEFEGITVKWAGMRYTPDFVVFGTPGLGPIRLIEVKGGHIWPRDIVRFKGARGYWPEFQFEMWQKTKSGWKEKYR